MASSMQEALHDIGTYQRIADQATFGSIRGGVFDIYIMSILKYIDDLGINL
jgi:hypothetical protein